MPPTTRIRFLTLRVFPIGKFTTNLLSELRALPPHKLRFANIVMPKTDAWRERQRQKSWGLRLWELLKEPRYKFFVKEGRTFTVRSGVPGVWEEVAKRIKEQTVEEGRGGGKAVGSRSSRIGREMEKQKVVSVRRQTSRVSSK
jgi:hypothetical protein